MSQTNLVPTLYPIGDQREGKEVKGTEIEKHLLNSGEMDLCFALSDPLVERWLQDPATYPQEFKGTAVCLWKSVVVGNDPDRRERRVPYLFWREYPLWRERPMSTKRPLKVGWEWLTTSFNSSYLVLLRK